MKRLFVALIFVTLSVVSLLIFKKERTVSSNQPDTAKSTTGRRTLVPTRDFWDSAHVPDPGEDPPISVILPENLGITVPTTPVDPSALISKGILENNLPAIQSAALTWFQQDPVAARNWLASQSTLEDLQPAISYIAAHISERGDLKTAIEWVNILKDPNTKENTLFEIQSLALRNRRITPEQIITNGLSADRIEELLSGAAGD